MLVVGEKSIGNQQNPDEYSGGEESKFEDEDQ